MKTKQNNISEAEKILTKRWPINNPYMQLTEMSTRSIKIMFLGSKAAAGE
jgi:hypothetical protein